MKQGICTIFIFFSFSFVGCFHSSYKIKVENTAELKSTIIEVERQINKIETLPIYKDLDYKYPLFWFKDDGIMMTHTVVNYDPNDSIREERRNPNSQEHIDTCQIMPGLTVDEWTLLKKDLKKLENFGIRGNNVAFYNDAKFEFFYYSYLYPEDWEYKDIGYLSLLSEEIINTKDFKQRFVVMDRKDDIYMIKRVR